VLAPRLAARGYAVTVADLTWFGNLADFVRSLDRQPAAIV
jgi:hypothetical protein